MFDTLTEDEKNECYHCLGLDKAKYNYTKKLALSRNYCGQKDSKNSIYKHLVEIGFMQASLNTWKEIEYHINDDYINEVYLYWRKNYKNIHYW